LKIWDLVDDFSNEQLKNKSKATVDAYMSDLKKFREYFDKDFEEINEDRIQEYKTFLLSKLKAKTVNRKLVSIRKFIEFLNKSASITSKFDVTIKLIKIQRQEYLSEMLNLNDFERLVRAAECANDKRAVAIFYTLFYTGLRVSEMLTLSINDLNKKSVEVLGKGSKYRELKILEKLKKHLKVYIDERKHKENSKIFLNRKNNSIMGRQTIHNIIKHYAGKSKIKKTKAHAHNFRHLFALRCLEEGFSIDEIADLLGHTDINTTRIYIKKTKKELYEKMEEKL
jgi:integrase/recombinase XerD